MFLPLTKIESQNIKVIGDKKSVLNLKLKSKLVTLYKLCFCFTNHTCLKVSFKFFPLFYWFLSFRITCTKKLT